MPFNDGPLAPPPEIPPATEPWEHKEIARLKAEVAHLEESLAGVYSRVLNFIRGQGLYHAEAVRKTNEVLGVTGK